MRDTSEALRYELDSYFANGGTFNPEMMDHQKVQRLVGRCRDYLIGRKDEHEALVRADEREKKCLGTLRECEHEIISLRRHNEILSAKVEVMDLFAQVLNTEPAKRRYASTTPDVLFNIVKRLEGL